MRFVERLIAASFIAVVVGCGGGGTAPAAPSNLTAEALGGGAHLSWRDNSDDETEFMIMRRLGAESDFDTIATVAANETQFHDAPLTSGETYVYVVMAMNDAGASESGELEFAAP